jgi:hypothetical protein
LLCHPDSSVIGGFELRHKSFENGDFAPLANGTCHNSIQAAPPVAAPIQTVAQPAVSVAGVKVTPIPSSPTPVPVTQAAPQATPETSPSVAAVIPCWQMDQAGNIQFDESGAPIPCGSIVEASPETIFGPPNAGDGSAADALVP